MSASPKDFTTSKLAKMGLASGAIDSDDGTIYDDRGTRAAGRGDSSQFKRGGAVHGAGRKSNLGRPGRASGGAVSGSLHRTLRTEKETVRDEKKDVPRGRLEANIQNDRPSAKLNKKYAQPKLVHKDKAPVRDKRARADQAHASKANEKALERSGAFARGGKVKPKTTVNVIVAPQGGQAGAGAPPPMAPPPMAPPPMPPPRPPMPPPGQAGPSVNVMPPSAAAPTGAAGAPPPGIPPGLRARGGRVSNLGKFAHPPKAGFSDTNAPHIGGGRPGFSDTPMTSKRAPRADGAKDFGRSGKRDFGPGGTPSQAHVKQTHGSGSGLGRIDNARREA